MASDGSRMYWSTEDIKCLLQVWGEGSIQAQFDGVVRNDEIYRTIGEELKKVGIIRDVKQIREKIKKLKQQYRVAKDNNNRSGAGRAKFQWFDTMDEILGHRPGNDQSLLRNSSAATAPLDDSGEDTLLGKN